MRRFGVVGRADRGGLAAQSFAVAKHLGAQAALVVDLQDKGRGPLHLTPWYETVPEVRVCGMPATGEDLAWFLSRCDVAFSAEGPPPRRDDFGDLCASLDVDWFIHVNPELWREHYAGPTTRLILPTAWHADRFPDAPVVAMPVDRDRFPYRLREEARTFLHVCAPAMEDRSGTEIVRQALPFVTTPCRLLVRGDSEVRRETTIGKVDVVFLPPVEDHGDLYPPEADVLLHPRRYGGLSLVANEAQSSGMPVVMTDVEPQRGRPGMVFVPVVDAVRTVNMIGGVERVHDVEPRQLALAVDLLAEQPQTVARLSHEADQWAGENAWTALESMWRGVLGL